MWATNTLLASVAPDHCTGCRRFGDSSKGSIWEDLRDRDFMAFGNCKWKQSSSENPAWVPRLDSRPPNLHSTEDNSVHRFEHLGIDGRQKFRWHLNPLIGS